MSQRLLLLRKESMCDWHAQWFTAVLDVKFIFSSGTMVGVCLECCWFVCVSVTWCCWWQTSSAYKQCFPSWRISWPWLWFCFNCVHGFINKYSSSAWYGTMVDVFHLFHGHLYILLCALASIRFRNFKIWQVSICGPVFSLQYLGFVSQP